MKQPHRWRRPGERTEDDIDLSDLPDRILDGLLADIPEHDRPAARAEFLARLRARHAELGIEVPPWLSDSA